MQAEIITATCRETILILVLEKLSADDGAVVFWLGIGISKEANYM